MAKKKKDLIDKELKRKYSFFEIVWYAYGILFGPIEVLIMYLLSNGFGLFKAALYLLVISFILMFIPLVLRLIFKLFGKEIFYYDTIDEMIPLAIFSSLFTWGVFTLIDSWKEGALNAIILTALLVAGIAGVQSIPYFISKLFYNSILNKINPNKPEPSSYSYSNDYTTSYTPSYNNTKTKSDVDKRREEEAKKEKEYYDKNFRIKHEKKDIYDQWGNFIGTKETTTIGDWQKTTEYKDEFGRKMDEETKYTIKY